MDKKCSNCTEYLNTISSIKDSFNRKLQLINTDNQILKAQIEKFCKINTVYSEPVNNVSLIKQIDFLLKIKDLLEKENKRLKSEKFKSQNVCASCSKSIIKLIDQVVESDFYKADKDPSYQLMKGGSMSNIESICKKFLKLEISLKRHQEWSQDINEKYTNSLSLIEKLNRENDHLKSELETLKIELKDSRTRTKVDLLTNDQVKVVKTKSKQSKITNSCKKLKAIVPTAGNIGKSKFQELNSKRIQEIEKMLMKIPKIPVKDDILFLPESKSSNDRIFNNNSNEIDVQKEQFEKNKINKKKNKSLVDNKNRNSIISENLSDSSDSPIKNAKERKISQCSTYSLRSGKVIKNACNPNKNHDKIEENRKCNSHIEDLDLSDSDFFNELDIGNILQNFVSNASSMECGTTGNGNLDKRKENVDIFELEKNVITKSETQKNTNSQRFNETNENVQKNIDVFNLSDSDDFYEDKNKQNSISNDAATSKSENVNDDKDDIIKGKEEIMLDEATEKPIVDINICVNEINHEQIPAQRNESRKLNVKLNEENSNFRLKTSDENEEIHHEMKITNFNIDTSEKKTNNNDTNIVDIVTQNCCLNDTIFKCPSLKIGEPVKNLENCRKSLKRKKSTIKTQKSKKAKSNEFCNSSSDSDLPIEYSNDKPLVNHEKGDDNNSGMSNISETEELSLKTLEPINEHIHMPSNEFLINLDLEDEINEITEDIPKSINENQNNSIIIQSQNSITNQSTQSTNITEIELISTQIAVNDSHETIDFSEKSLIEDNKDNLDFNFDNVDFGNLTYVKFVNISGDPEIESTTPYYETRNTPRIHQDSSMSDDTPTQSKISVPMSEYNFQMLKSLNIKKDISKKKSKPSLETRIKNFLDEIFIKETPVELSIKKYKITSGSEFVFDLFSRQFFAFFYNQLITNRCNFTDLSSILHRCAAAISKVIGLCCAEQNRALVIFQTRLIEDLLKLKITDSSLHLIRFILSVLFKLHSSLKQSHLSTTVIIDLLNHSKIPASIIISTIDSHFIDYSNLDFQNFPINILITVLRFLWHFEELHISNQISNDQIQISESGQRFWTCDRSDNPKLSIICYLREQLIRNPDCLELINLLFSIAKNRCYL